jgi:hypothetical protein
MTLSAQFGAVVMGSQQPTFEARVVQPGATGDDPDGESIDIVDGAVVMDGTADIQRTLDLTTIGHHLFPRRAGDLLLPDGTEVFVRRGVDLGDEVLWAPLGYFRIQANTQDDAPDGTIRVAGFDRMRAIVDSPLMSPRQFPPETSFGAVFASLVGDVHPDAVIDWDDETEHEPIGRLLVVERSRYEPLRTLAAGRGKIVHFDGIGVLRVRTAPDPTEPLWRAWAGRHGTMSRARRQITRDDVINAVVVRSQGADALAPVRAIALDDGPHSMTRFGGRFGEIPEHVTVPATSTLAQVRQAARLTLLRRAGLPYQVSFEAVPNPAMQPYDPGEVRLSDGTRERHVAQRLRMPLRARALMTVDTREQRLSRIRVVDR